MGKAVGLAVGLILCLSFAASGCAATSSDADCQFVPVSGLAKHGDSKSVTIEVSNGQWPEYPLGPETEWSADGAAPSWAPESGNVIGIATYDRRGDLSVDFGQGRVVQFPHVGCM